MQMEQRSRKMHCILNWCDTCKKCMKIAQNKQLHADICHNIRKLSSLFAFTGQLYRNNIVKRYSHTWICILELCKRASVHVARQKIIKCKIWLWTSPHTNGKAAGKEHVEESWDLQLKPLHGHQYKKWPEELRRYAPTKVKPYWHLTFDIQPMDQWTNGQMDQWTNGPMDQWTNGPMD